MKYSIAATLWLSFAPLSLLPHFMEQQNGAENGNWEKHQPTPTSPGLALSLFCPTLLYYFKKER